VLVVGTLAWHERERSSYQSDSRVAPPSIASLVAQLDPYPTYVTGRRWDVLTANRGARALFTDWDALPLGDRNMLWWVFTGSQLCLSPEIALGRRFTEAQRLKSKNWRIGAPALRVPGPRPAAGQWLARAHTRWS
jgi:MmyB-like transcription regulator ligand binding domain